MWGHISFRKVEGVMGTDEGARGVLQDSLQLAAAAMELANKATSAKPNLRDPEQNRPSMGVVVANLSG